MARSRRRRGLAAGIAGILAATLVAILTQPPRGAATPSGPSADPSPMCKLSGKRYVGKTSQQKRLCLTLTRDGMRLRECAYEYRAKCKQASGIVRLTTSNGSIRSIFRKPLALGRDGTFASTGGSGFFKGKIGPGLADGTLRLQSTQQVPGSVTPPITYVTAACDSGLVRRTARKASG